MCLLHLLQPNANMNCLDCSNQIPHLAYFINVNLFSVSFLQWAKYIHGRWKPFILGMRDCDTFFPFLSSTLLTLNFTLSLSLSITLCLSHTKPNSPLSTFFYLCQHTSDNFPADRLIAPSFVCCVEFLHSWILQIESSDAQHDQTILFYSILFYSILFYSSFWVKW